MKKLFDLRSPTSFKFTVGSGSDSPVLLYFPSWIITDTSSAQVRVVNEKQPQNQCSDDYLNRYWVMNSSGIDPYTANVKFYYKSSDDNAAGKTSISLMVPGNVTSNFYESTGAGRRILKAICPATGCTP